MEIILHRTITSTGTKADSGPLELPVVSLLRHMAQAFEKRPITLILDPEFSIRFGDFIELRGFDEIITGTWQAAAMRDLEDPLRLVID